MPSIRDSIDEMIEESYLLGLSKSEIKADLDRFVEICGKIIHENVHDRKQIQKLTEKLARARALSLIEEHHEEDPEQDAVLPDGKKAVGSSRGRFAERVARNKRLILRTINDCDPLLLQVRVRLVPYDLPAAARAKNRFNLNYTHENSRPR